MKERRIDSCCQAASSSEGLCPQEPSPRVRARPCEEDGGSALRDWHRIVPAVAARGGRGRRLQDAHGFAAGDLLHGSRQQN